MRLIFLFIIFFFISCNDEANLSTEKMTIENNKDFISMKKNIKEYKFKEAFSMFEKLAKLYPKNEKLYNELYILSKKSSSDIKQLINILNIILAINPENNKLYFELANNYFLIEKDKEAINNYDTFLKYYPNSIKGNYKLAYLYFIHQKYKEASKYFLKTIKLDDKYLWAYYYLSKIYMDYEKDVKKAIDLLEKARKKLNLKEFEKELGFELALVYLKNKEYEKSIDLFKKLKQNNNYLNSYYLVEAYNELKKYDESINLFKELVKNDHLNAKKIYKLAKLYILKDEYKNAIDTLNYLIKINNNPKYIYSLGLIYFTLKDNNNLQEIKRLLIENPRKEKSKYLKLLEEKIDERNYIKREFNLSNRKKQNINSK